MKKAKETIFLIYSIMKLYYLQFLLFVSMLVNIPANQIAAQETEPDILKYYEIMNSFKEERDSILNSKIGTPFVSFDLTDLTGKQFTQKHLMGKVTLINFWFRACAPCIAEFDDLNDLYNDFKDNPDFQFLSITRDEPEDIEKSIKKYNLPYTIISTSDKECRRLQHFEIGGYPFTIIVDKQGKIRLIHGGSSLEKEKITTLIETYKQEILKLLDEEI